MDRNLADIRNIGIIAHIDAGKTTTTERILYYSRKIHRIGEVDDGSATMDWMEEEKERGITITSAVTTCYWKGKQINIIDTPGHIDFTGEVERSLRVLDGTVMIFSAVEGVESQSESVWLQADRYEVPRIVYINKLDRMGAEPNSCINMIKDRLNAYPLELQFPIGIEKDFCGICDVLSEKIIEWLPGTDGTEFTTKDVPETLKSTLNEKKKEILELIALKDDEIAELYLSDQPISNEQLIKTIRRLTTQRKLVPIFLGTSLRNIGVQQLMDGIVDYLPSPIERMEALKQLKRSELLLKSGELGQSDNQTIRQSDNIIPFTDSKFCALAFKIQTDQHGKLVYMRVYSGKIKIGQQILNANNNTTERIAQIFLMHANKRQIISEAEAGDIVAVYGPKEVRTGHTLTDVDSNIKLKALEMPEPVVFAKIEPKTHQDEEKFVSVLDNLMIDDPTVEVKIAPDTGETLIGGMGELHLEVICQRMEREFGLKTKMGIPQVAYKETITKQAVARGKFIKQSGGKGQYGDVIIRVEPAEKGKGFSFREEVKEGAIPREYWGAIQKGVESAVQVGVLAGFPIVDLEVILTGGSYHPVDSSEIAFEAAGSMAVKEAIGKAHPILLEPEMKLEIIIPPEYLGNVLDDLGVREGKVLSLSGTGIRHTIFATCPLRKLFGYATTLRSLTQGRVVYLMKFESYKELPSDEQSAVLEKIRGY
ncbi:MAG: elongation factor G [Candidatus Stahlbacteria bacterium]|nr:elongation factor G [Candidatus Stahlbacteria bacterium]